MGISMPFPDMCKLRTSANIKSEHYICVIATLKFERYFWGSSSNMAGSYPVLDLSEMQVDLLQDFHTLWPPKHAKLHTHWRCNWSNKRLNAMRLDSDVFPARWWRWLKIDLRRVASRWAQSWHLMRSCAYIYIYNVYMCIAQSLILLLPPRRR